MAINPSKLLWNSPKNCDGSELIDRMANDIQTGSGPTYAFLSSPTLTWKDSVIS